MLMKFDPYGTSMSDRSNRILILFLLYRCSKHNLSTILVEKLQNIIQAFGVFYLYILFMFGLSPLWDTVSMNLAQ